jgi:hypothetical protein
MTPRDNHVPTIGPNAAAGDPPPESTVKAVPPLTERVGPHL